MNEPRYRIAVITPVDKEDTQSDTLLEGLHILRTEKGSLDFRISSITHPEPFPLEQYMLARNDFIAYAHEADLILLISRKRLRSYDPTNFKLASSINEWHKTIFIDAYEVGNNNRFDFSLQYKILTGTHKGYGNINPDMLAKCALYFRREKPYLDGIIPLPYAIDRRYVRYNPSVVKDIDFTCVFGQDQYPLLRRYARKILIDFCKKNRLSCHVGRTKSQAEFRDILAHTKVGISVGGGGFDTLRFWEILGNNCMLMTERIDIYPTDSTMLDYKRIIQFGNLYDFQYQLVKVGNFIRSDYRQDALQDEYDDIMHRHSSTARVITIIDEAKKKVMIA